MPCQDCKKIYLLFAILVSSMVGFAQSSCPPNLDFEFGDFSSWVCKTGNVYVSGGQNTLNLSTTGVTFNRHTIIPYTDTSKDIYGGFPVLCPNGSGYSVKLGNNLSGSQAEGISYTYAIPVTATNFSILYQYAVVFEDPHHAPEEQPRFRARILNLTSGDTIGCVSFDFTASANLPGFKISPLSSDVLYKDWTPVSLDLSAYAGMTIRLEFITSDCTLGGHFGYAYVDVNSSCNGAVVGSTVCVGDTIVNLTAPYGYQSYAWYPDLGFSQIIGTSQILTLSPAPNTGNVYPVIVTPYPGFGCIDTVFATIQTDAKPISVAGPDNTVCRYMQTPLGTSPNPANLYYWTPANLVTNPILANPNGFLNTFSPQQFIVKTTTRASGCFSFDTVILSPVSIDTSLLVNGKLNYCNNEVYNTLLTVSNQSSGIQWLNNNIPIGGATGNNYTPPAGGIYRAKFIQNGCTDTTRAVILSNHVSPIAKYTVNKDTQCITNNSFVFTNQSTISNNDPLVYLWRFGDGTISQNANPVKSYSTVGIQNINFIVSSIYGCADSIPGVLNVTPNIEPDFNWNVACNNSPILFTNLSKEHGSLSVKYLWNFDNGTVSTLKTPLTFIYSNPGLYNVSMQAIAIGCEAAPQSVLKPIIVYAPKPGIRYRDITVPSTYSSRIYARLGIGNFYNWSPATQLTNPYISAPYFIAVNDTKYLIAITDINKCITTDTIQMHVLTKKGSYMPNAFTPNGDGLNDVIRPYLQGTNGLIKFSIYNRLGNLLFSTSRDGEGWNGNYKGLPVESGVFVWVLEFIDINNKNTVQKGTLMLVR